MPPKPASATRVLAIASAGGHWIQLMRLRPALDGAQVTWATTRAELAAGLEGKVHVVADGSASNPLRVLRSLFQVFWLLLHPW